tara:strand:+ start:841 stop:1770 length:930 start_codon:yes stop_codon:yes gene_type:complete
MINNILVGLVESVLGKGTSTSRGNYAFHCPFCNHRKKKLEVNLVPTKKNLNPWHCWVCDARGKTLHSLFKRKKVSKEKFQSLHSILGTTEKYDTVVQDINVELPKEYIPLNHIPRSNIVARHAISYLKKRGLSIHDILSYQIGYCEQGRFANKIIIPSYDLDGKLEYFIARAFLPDAIRKYDAPVSDKNIIGFENRINWDLPIVLCEGAFDAIAIKRNAIPLFGKNISKKLMKKIVTNSVKKVYLALDEDAIKSTFKISEQLLKAGKKLYVVELDGKDPSEMGFTLFTKRIQEAQPFTFSSLLNLKLNL